MPGMITPAESPSIQAAPAQQQQQQTLPAASSAVDIAMPTSSTSQQLPQQQQQQTAATPLPLDPEQLSFALQTQLEFYFSKQNLSTDKYLISQMNEARYVPTDVIAEFKMIKKLTTDREMITQAMRKSKLLEITDDDSMVRAVSKAERTTIILRDIPSNTPVEEVKSIFDNENCGQVQNIYSDIGDTWFVTFETEDECLQTAMYIRQQSFNGKPIRMRVKSENLVRSFYQQPSQLSEWAAHSAGYFPPSAMYQNRGDNRSQEQTQRDGTGHHPGYMPHPGGRNWNPNMRGQAGAPVHYGDRRNGPFQPGMMAESNGDYPRNERRAMRGDRDGRRKPNHGQTHRKNTQNRQTRKPKQRTNPNKRSENKAPNIQLGPEHFPALPSSKKEGGYEAPFRTYSREQMATIVKNLADNPIPETMKSDSSEVVSQTPLPESQLMKPFPVFFPGSPSPMLAAQKSRSVPLLDLAESTVPPSADGSATGDSAPSVTAQEQPAETSALSAIEPENSGAEPSAHSSDSETTSGLESRHAVEAVDESGGEPSPSTVADSSDNLEPSQSSQTSLKPISYAEIARRAASSDKTKPDSTGDASGVDPPIPVEESVPQQA